MTHLTTHQFRATARFIFTGLLAIGLMASTAIPALGSGTFAKTGSMNVGRISHTATLLSNGEVLVAGGANSIGSYLASAELYSPATGSWTLTGSMTTARENHQAVLLTSGEVLVAGGINASGTLATAELYNPSTGAWTATGSMITARYNFSLTLLPDGEVLAVQDTSCELYNPATGTWTATGSPTGSVGGPNAALLQDGQVLAIGEGSINNFNVPSELYNPSTGAWSATGTTGTVIPNPITPRLQSGEVFVAGSFQSGNVSVSRAALYDPSTGQFTPEPGPCNCRGFNGALISTGEFLVAGGYITVRAQPYPITETTSSGELWDPSTQAWTSTGNLNISRGGESMTILPNGQALVAGGEHYDKHLGHLVVTATVELYSP